MPLFVDEKLKYQKRTKANSLSLLAKQAYKAAKLFADTWAEYGGSDTDYNDAVEAAFASPERDAFDAMAALFQTAVDGVETDYSDFLENA